MAAVQEGLDLVGLQNEPKFGQAERLVVHRAELNDLGGLVDLVLFALFALSLRFLKLLKRVAELAIDAGSVPAEAIEFFAQVNLHQGGGEGFVDFGAVGVDLIAESVLPVGVDGQLVGEGTMQAPLRVAEGLDEIRFGVSYGLPFVAKFHGKGGIDIEVVAGHHHRLAAKKVATGVDGRARFSLGSARAMASSVWQARLGAEGVRFWRLMRRKAI